MALVAAIPGLPTQGPESGAEDRSPVRPRRLAVGAQLVRSKVRIPRFASMSRERLESLADEARRHRLTLVVAPAGSGKTTLMSRWAAAAEAAGSRVGWYRAESTDATASTFLGYLQLAIGEALRPSGERDASTRAGTRPWQTVEEAAAWLEGSRAEGMLLLIDDFHALAGSEAETALARFIDLAGPSVCIVVGTRSLPSFDLSRLRLSGNLLEITGDDLRFRSWEVERLFREYYGEVLRGDELGRLARRTEGWAAGLQFFHLATRDKSPVERTRLLQALGGSTRLVREYLARNVLDELPEELRQVLTCRRIDDAQATVQNVGAGAAAQVLTASRRRHTAELLRADGNEDVRSLKALQERVAPRGPPAVPSARNAEKTRAYEHGLAISPAIFFGKEVTRLWLLATTHLMVSPRSPALSLILASPKLRRPLTSP